jgi:hypothetical protein
MELLVSMSIASVVLAAVLSTVTFVARGSIATADYSDMDREARIGLETFARDIRRAQRVTNASLLAETVTLDVVTGYDGAGAQIVASTSYTYVPADKTLYREYGESSQRALIKNIESFELKYYSIALDGSGQQREASNALETKQIQLELRSVRSGPAKASASNNVVSARYVLRNKVD